MGAAAKTGRNERCPCGSGRKLKVCCGAAPGAAKASASLATQAEVFALARRLLEARQYEAAIEPLSQAAKLAPNNPSLLNDLAMACLLARRPPEAVVWLRRSLALRSDFAGTHYNLGLALEQTGDGAGALASHERAIALAPSFAAAHARVAELLMNKGKPNEAALAYERAAAAEPDTTLGGLSSAKGLMLQGRGALAEERLRQLVARDPSSSEAHVHLGLVLAEAGHFDEASASFAQSIELEPRQAIAHHGLLTSKRLTEADRPLLARTLSRLEAPDLSDEARMTLHFAAGKALDDLANYEAAMQHFDAANRVRRTLSRPFDARDFGRRVDALIARFTPELFARETDAANRDDETPLLVLGMPRSGTTLIERILASHPQIAGGGELVFWNEHAPAWLDATRDTREEADALRAAYLRVLHDVAADAVRVTDKMPFNFLWVGLVHLLFPRARVVHCRRNPVDTCLSIYSTRFAQSWGFASDRGDLVAYFRQYERLVAHWRAVLPEDRWLDVDYEGATAAPEETARRLIAFTDLPWDPSCLKPEESAAPVKTASKWQARQPIYRSSVERWRHYEPWLGSLRSLLPADS